MKNFFLALIILIVVASSAAYIFMNKIITKTIEKVGSDVTGVDVSVGSVSLSLLSGTGAISNLTIGNPDGFKGEYAFKADKIEVVVDVNSILTDLIKISKIEVQAPEINYELAEHGTNFAAILANSEKKSDNDESENKQSSRKLTIDDLFINNAKVTLAADFAGKHAGESVALPDIHISGIGKESNGSNSANVIMQILGSINENIIKSVGTGSFLDNVKETIDNVKEKITNFLDKK